MNPRDAHTADLGVLFVCLGNICRSPLARAILEHQAGGAGVRALHVDSCGTGHWHVGGPADSRTIRVAQRRGVRMNHVARQLDPARDFNAFRLIVPMDARNRTDLLRAGAPEHRVRLVRSFEPAFHGDHAHAPDVPDPYTGGDDGFERVFDMLWASCEGLLARVRTGTFDLHEPT